MSDLIPHLGPKSSAGDQSLDQARVAPQSPDKPGINSSQPTWLTPAYLRQHRSGDRISRFR